MTAETAADAMSLPPNPRGSRGRSGRSRLGVFPQPLRRVFHGYLIEQLRLEDVILGHSCVF